MGCGSDVVYGRYGEDVACAVDIGYCTPEEYGVDAEADAWEFGTCMVESGTL